MDHSPTQAEQAVIDELVTRYRFEPVTVRATVTMLEKSIIDANAALRAMLARSGIVSFEHVAQGEDGKVTYSLPIACGDHVEDASCSFYRPLTKRGDPRVWPHGLKRLARAGDLLVFAFHEQGVALLVLGRADERLLDRAGDLLPRRYEERGDFERVLREATIALADIRGRWHPTLRRGPTGVGFTLESLLGLQANTRRDTDLAGIELKAFRRGPRTGVGKLVTLFSQVPDRWLVPDGGLGLLRDDGYPSRKTGRRQLYCTITSTPNSLGWRIDLQPDRDALEVSRSGNPRVAYGLQTLDSRLKEKHPATLFVTATTRGRGATEEFRYEDVVLCRQPSLASFVSLIDRDLLGLDLTLSLEEGRARDHGYLWRIREASIPELFAYRRPVDFGPRMVA